MIVDPMVAMRAACLAVQGSEADEVEIHFSEIFDDREVHMDISVRRKVRDLTLTPVPPSE